MAFKRIALFYPPILSGGRYPLITQNRQFKYTNSLEIRIYPVIMSTLATMLDQGGAEVLFLDGINRRLSYQDALAQLVSFNPELVVMETKAPLMTALLEVAADIRQRTAAKILFCGDHASYFPEQVLGSGQVDYVALGGYYDFIIRDLVFAAPGSPLPGGILQTEPANADRSITGRREVAAYDLDTAPLIDRELTRFRDYGEAYLYKPVAYILSGRGCGGKGGALDRMESSTPGRCAFCIWQHALWHCGAKLRNPESVAEEIDILVRKYKVKEVFDDNESGGVWSQWWLEAFHQALVRRGLIGKFFLSSNARADSLSKERVALLKAIGYRLLKVGLESANDATLTKINKDETFAQIETGIKNAKAAGLSVLMTTMVGYPWETEADARHTYEQTKALMLYRTHFGDSLQSSIVVSYPGTPLYRYAETHDLLTDEAREFRNYDMEHRILKTSIDTAYWCKRMWRIHLHPLFLIKSFCSLRRLQDVKLAFSGLVSLLGHLRDYES